MLGFTAALRGMAIDTIEILGKIFNVPRIGGLTWRAWRLIQRVRVRGMLTAGRLTDEENLLYLLAKGDPYMRAAFFNPVHLSADAIRKRQEERRSQSIRSVGISASQILTQARKEASRLKHPIIGVEHLLLALLAWETPDSEFLRSAGVTAETVEARIRKGISFSRVTIGIPKITYYEVPARNANPSKSSDEPTGSR